MVALTEKADGMMEKSVGGGIDRGGRRLCLGEEPMAGER